MFESDKTIRKLTEKENMTIKVKNTNESNKTITKDSSLSGGVHLADMTKNLFSK